MREIKFRIWNKKDRNMDFGVTPDPSKYEKFWGDCGSSAEHWIPEDPDDYSDLMQFTGLKDKTGKEIYEGDILVFSQVRYSVEWEVMCAGWFGHRLDDKTRHSWGLSQDGVNGMEVIGNIHENPDLILAVGADRD